MSTNWVYYNTSFVTFSFFSDPMIFDLISLMLIFGLLQLFYDIEKLDSTALNLIYSLKILVSCWILSLSMLLL